MSRTRWVLEVDLQNGNKHLRYFKIELPWPQGEGYRQIVSWNSFFYSKRNRNGNKFLYSQTEPEFFWFKMENIPEITVSSVWELYEKIGYNYKTKKYKPCW